MKSWEYSQRSCPASELLKTLTACGRDGWEAVHISVVYPRNPLAWIDIILKREKGSAT